MKHEHKLDTAKNKPQFDYRHMCHLWLMWNDGLLEEGTFIRNRRPEVYEMDLGERKR